MNGELGGGRDIGASGELGARRDIGSSGEMDAGGDIGAVADMTNACCSIIAGTPCTPGSPAACRCGFEDYYECSPVGACSGYHWVHTGGVRDMTSPPPPDRPDLCR